MNYFQIMSSTSLFRNAVPYRSLFRMSNLMLDIPNNYLQCMYGATNFKFHICMSSKNHAISKNDKSSIQIDTESDQFGTLRKPLEKNTKVKYNSSLNSNLQDKKKIIKIKRPEIDESDVFGNLSENKPIWYSDFKEEPKKDNDLSDDSVILKNLGKKYRSPERYLSEMKRLVKEKKVNLIHYFASILINF